MYTFYMGTGFVMRDSDSKIVAPCQATNDADFLAYNEWAAAGNFPEFVEAPSPKISKVTPRQIRQALTRIGLRDIVENAVANSHRDVKDSWEFSTEVNRDDPLLVALAAALGVSEDDVDNLFTLASTL